MLPSPSIHPDCRPRLPAVALTAIVFLAGCASSPVAPRLDAAEAAVAAAWQAPLPHGGQLETLSRWWAQFEDPLLLGLLEAGQQACPTVAQAGVRIVEAQAARVAQRAAALPSVDANTSSTRGRLEVGAPVATASSAGLLFGWELDLFGAQRAAVRAAQARLEARRAEWHEARVSVAAEVATTYLELRACEAQVTQAELDVQSRRETARVTSLVAQAGFQPPAAADLAQASAAQGNVTWLEQRMQCELLIKALVALTAQDESVLRRDLALGAGRLPTPIALGVSAIPAEALAQRPDIYAAEREVLAASAESDQAQALRWPRIGLAGTLGTTRISSQVQDSDGVVWSLGPVTVTLPIFDAGLRRAEAQAAKARYEGAITVYSARLRAAIREVESALVTLDSTAQRNEDAVLAAQGFERSWRATEARFRAGIASLFELEDARRNWVVAQSAVIELQRERLSAWIDLYRALGGGWSENPGSPAPKG